jgi:hypothetical protein
MFTHVTADAKFNTMTRIILARQRLGTHIPTETNAHKNRTLIAWKRHRKRLVNNFGGVTSVHVHISCCKGSQKSPTILYIQGNDTASNSDYIA